MEIICIMKDLLDIDVLDVVIIEFFEMFVVVNNSGDLVKEVLEKIDNV